MLISWSSGRLLTISPRRAKNTKSVAPFHCSTTFNPSLISRRNSLECRYRQPARNLDPEKSGWRPGQLQPLVRLRLGSSFDREYSSPAYAPTPRKYATSPLGNHGARPSPKAQARAVAPKTPIWKRFTHTQAASWRTACNIVSSIIKLKREAGSSLP